MNVNYEFEGINITGVVGKPEIARSNRANQIFFVNKRYIRDRILSNAAEKAFKGMIPIGKFGFLVLNIEMAPSLVDVNVHPAKLEVRFQEENKIFQAIYHAIKDTLLKTELVANTENKYGTIDRSAQSFEERLRIIRENNNKQQSGGLFSFRKQKEREIEQYNDEESKIKTNVIEDIVKEREKNNNIKKAQDLNIGQPINTEDILTQLKQMKEKLEKDIHEKEINKVEEKTQEYRLETREVKQEEEKIQENEKEETEAKSKTEQLTERDSLESDKITEKTQNVKDIDSEIKKIDNEEVQKEFEEVKEKMNDLKDNPKTVSEDFNEMYAKLFGTLPIQEKEEKVIEENQQTAIDIVKDNVSVFEGQEEIETPNYKFIGIAFKTYIILEINDEMYILDQHAAHERIMYEKVKENYYSDTSKDSQMLLLPDVITLSHKEMDIAKDNIKMFEQAGFSLEEFGENTIKLTGVPTVCIDLDTRELFLETLDEINTVARTAKQEKEEKFIATVACKAAVKANMALNSEEVESLMAQLLKLPNPFTCPHGRPTAIKMTKYDIERKFSRK